MRTADWTDSVSVLDRVTAVFDAYGEQDEGLGVSELARRANLPKSTVSRIAADLVTQRFLDRDGDKLYLGVRLFELAQSVEQPRRLRHFALPVMTELRDAIGQTVNLAMLEGADVVYIAILRGEPTSKPCTRIGSRRPAHATALGKAILAFSPMDVIERIIEAGMEADTPHTVSQPSALLRELSDIRRLGVATGKEECANDRACAASPILSHGSAPVAAISVAGSVSDVVPARIAPAVRAAGLALSRRMAAGSHR